MLASNKTKCSKTLALPAIHYEVYKSTMQSIELFFALTTKRSPMILIFYHRRPL